MTNPKPLSDELNKALEDLRAIRDEVRVQINLAGKEAKSHWDEIEPRLTKLERGVVDVSDAASAATVDLAKDMAKAFRTFRDRLKG